MSTRPRRRQAGSSSHQLPVLVRLVQSSDLPDGVNALASADGGTIIVRAGLDKDTRRRAVREVLAHRFPGLLAFPVLAGLHLRRALVAAAHWVSRAVQSATAVIPASPAFIVVAGAVVTASAAGGAVMALGGGAHPGARPPAHTGAPLLHGRSGNSSQLARHASRSAGHSSRVPSPRPGTTPVPAGSPRTPPLGPVTSPAGSLLPSPPVPLPSVSVSLPVPLPSVSVPPVPVPSPSLPPVLPSPSPTCVQVGPLGVCLTP
jgi:hypothetical protein